MNTTEDSNNESDTPPIVPNEVPNEELSKTIVQDTEQHLKNILIKIKNVEGTFFKHKYYLSNGFVLQLAACPYFSDSQYPQYKARTCPCGQVTICVSCHNHSHIITHFTKDGNPLCGSCAKRKIYKGNKIQIEIDGLDRAEQDEIQKLLYDEQSLESTVWSIRNKQSKLSRIIPSTSILSTELRHYLLKHGRHFIVPKQIVSFKISEDEE